MAGIFLIVLDEESAFWCLTQLMNNYSFQGMFTSGFPSLRKHFFIYEELIRDQLPSLYNHFVCLFFIYFLIIFNNFFCYFLLVLYLFFYISILLFYFMIIF